MILEKTTSFLDAFAFKLGTEYNQTQNKFRSRPKEIQKALRIKISGYIYTTWKA